MSRPDKPKNQRQEVFESEDVATMALGNISTTIGDINTTRTLYDLGYLLNCIAQQITVPIKAPRENKDSPRISTKR
ncbi:unnamed protein product [Caenorhabditis nigoni]